MVNSTDSALCVVLAGNCHIASSGHCIAELIDQQRRSKICSADGDYWETAERFFEARHWLIFQSDEVLGKPRKTKTRMFLKSINNAQLNE